MEETLSYLKQRYGEEQARFKHMEDKCAKFVSFLTIVIAAITATAGLKSGVVFSPEGILGWSRVVLLILAGFTACCAWGHSLLSLRIGDSPVMPLGRSTAEYLRDASNDEAQAHLFNCYVHTIEQLTAQINEKARYLEFAYQEIGASAWLIGALLTLTVLMELLQ